VCARVAWPALLCGPSTSPLKVMERARWQAEALARFPELAGDIRRAENPYQLWTDLHFAFDGAYDSGNPGMVRRIYEFARWCCEQPRGKAADDDLLTCVAVCFYEHIPTNPKALKDMPKWWKLKDVQLMKGIFSYLGGEALYAEVLSQFQGKRPRGKRRGKA
jgi:hypothetical protein